MIIKKFYRIVFSLLFYFLFFLGSVSAQGNLEVYFDRNENLIDLSLSKNEDTLHIETGMDSNKSFYLRGSLKYTFLPDKKISMNINGKGKIDSNDAGIYLPSGILILQHTIFDGKPLDDLILNYKINKDELLITSCKWQDFSLRGKIGLKEPYDAQIDLFISEMQLEDFARLLGIKDNNLSFYGKITALWQVSRKAGTLEVKAKLYSWEGAINNIEFKEANVFLEGLFPSLRFVNSWLVKKDESYMNIEGHFNITKLSDLKSPLHNIRLIPTEKRFQFSDWMISIKEGIAKGINLEKAISEDIILSMDTFSYDAKTEHFKNKDYIGLEYKMKKDQSLKMYLKENEEMLGWEKVFKF